MRIINDQGALTIRKPKGDKRAAILVAGDCCPRATGEDFIRQGKSDDILADLQDVFSAADLSMIQFETPLTTAETPIVKSGPNLKCHPDVVDFLHAQGVENWNGSAIVYCPGNFYFPWPKDRAYAPEDFWLLGTLVRFDIDADGVCGLQLFPTTFAADGSSIRQLAGKQRDGFYAYMKKISEPLKDWDKIIAFHECWAANSGYAKTLTNPAWTAADFDAPAPNKKLMPLRNLLTCEAHHEVLATYMRLVEEGRLESARKCAPLLKKLSAAAFMK